jgi:alpha-glucosidase
VRLIGHNETGGNIANYESQLDDAMKLYASVGIGLVKTGYVADGGGIVAPGDTPAACAWNGTTGSVRSNTT